MKRLIAALLAGICLSAFPLTVLGANTLRTTVVLPYYHVWKTDVPEADDRFTYRWTAETEDSPMPEGVTDSWWDWNLKGNVEGKLSLSFSHDTPGSYTYRLTAYVPKPKKGYVYERRTYLLTVLVEKDKEGTLCAEWFLLNERTGKKVDQIDLDPSFSSSRLRFDKRSSSQSDQNAGIDSDRSGRKGRKSRRGHSSQSGSASQGVKTGDETRVESMLKVLFVSALLLAYLVYEELREQKIKRK